MASAIAPNILYEYIFISIYLYIYEHRISTKSHIAFGALQKFHLQLQLYSRLAYMNPLSLSQTTHEKKKKWINIVRVYSLPPFFKIHEQRSSTDWHYSQGQFKRTDIELLHIDSTYVFKRFNTDFKSDA